MVDRFRLVPAAYVVMRRDDGAGRVLLQLRKDTGFMDGYWAVAAAGHVEDGESVFDAACREVAEEVGVTVEVHELTSLCVMHRTRTGGAPIDQRVDFFFECRRWRGEPYLVEPDKAADLQWFALDALPHPVVPHELLVLEHVRAGHVPPVLAYGFDTSDPG
ncbi:NUDIX domain-containing protein [Actinobacteria bacterium YIM 96077]|uniref:DNA mismatch repair protein MutT n=1 Tax=Phytoactinopolyspora halophila TaxID=1981511 RepID=A0A329R2R0_9ACTN|nr:NUDIX domain-containing protein [Phytoactinopolyspora halophila]AYY15269.1 NUDIX domain-containing protein [Actinobacteria bacterium YIM 96077]RAW18934.1 DNA mismatch repair protein MutT [Phytoactinopolyspora halophila]